MPTATVVFSALMAATSTKKTTTTSGSGIAELLFFVVIAGVFYVFFIRPRSQAVRRQRDTLMELVAGDEVLTAAGIFGTVLDVEPDRVTLETAPGTRITVVRSTIARKIVEPDANSVAEQNWHDEGHDGVAAAAAWHDPDEDDEHGDHDEHHGDDEHDGTNAHDSAGDEDETTKKPEADGAPGAGQGGGR
jgi:preprotein translocase subunit YajC